MFITSVRFANGTAHTITNAYTYICIHTYAYIHAYITHRAADLSVKEVLLNYHAYATHIIGSK